MVGAGRFELPTSWSQTRRATAAPRPARTMGTLPVVGIIQQAPGRPVRCNGDQGRRILIRELSLVQTSLHKFVFILRIGA